MNLTNISIYALAAGVIFNSFHCIVLGRRIGNIERKRERLYQQLADPELIEEEMEKGARLREMKDANRTTLPREDQVGQHARVFRPKLRSKLPPQYRPKA